jgi:nitroreductase
MCTWTASRSARCRCPSRCGRSCGSCEPAQRPHRRSGQRGTRRSRAAIRCAPFCPRRVPRPLIEDILRVASRAPSGTNAQPWKVYVLQGAVRDELVRQVSDAHEAIRQRPELAAEYREAYDYYPRQWVEPYLSRRRHNGWSLYGLLGIERGDKDRMHAQHHRNYGFFDAPVGLMFTLERVMGAGQPGRLRHVPAEHHAGGPRTRPAHLRPGRVEPVFAHRAAADRRVGAGNAGSAAWRWATRTSRRASTPSGRRASRWRCSPRWVDQPDAAGAGETS